MNDADIRRNFHKKKLRRYHEDLSTLVVDELGLRHGACRADIAVVNGRLLGYEIKSDSDMLLRLPRQVSGYNAVFDRVTIIAAERHISAVRHMVPDWWGITRCIRGSKGGIHFITDRRARPNPDVDLVSIAKLLWKTEVVQILRERGAHVKALRGPRSVLYDRLAESLVSEELKETVRLVLKNRRNWRCQKRLSQHGDLCQPSATL